MGWAHASLLLSTAQQPFETWGLSSIFQSSRLAGAPWGCGSIQLILGPVLTAAWLPGAAGTLGQDHRPQEDSNVTGVRFTCAASGPHTGAPSESACSSVPKAEETQPRGSEGQGTLGCHSCCLVDMAPPTPHLPTRLGMPSQGFPVCVRGEKCLMGRC